MSEQLIIIKADRSRSDDFLSRPLPAGFSVILPENAVPFAFEGVRAVFLLDDSVPDFSEMAFTDAGIPVFINSIDRSIDQLPQNFCVARINAWPGFLKNKAIEISYSDKNSTIIESFLNDLNWTYIRITDQPGMAIPRIVAMIINEACYAVNENVSSKEEIDIAMKLGTSYPFGPFEWGRVIGPQRILSLLETLAETNERYRPAPFFKKIFGL